MRRSRSPPYMRIADRLLQMKAKNVSIDVKKPIGQKMLISGQKATTCCCTWTRSWMVVVGFSSCYFVAQFIFLALHCLVGVCSASCPTNGQPWSGEGGSWSYFFRNQS